MSIQSVDYRRVLSDLRAKLRALQDQFRRDEAKLKTAIEAIEAISAEQHQLDLMSEFSAPATPEIVTRVEGAMQPARQWAEMSMREAAVKLIKMAGRGMTTNDLWAEMEARGITSTSTKPINNLYNILNRSKEQFKRRNGLWEVVE